MARPPVPLRKTRRVEPAPRGPSRPAARRRVHLRPARAHEGGQGPRPVTRVRRAGRGERALLRDLRLAALREAPDSFGQSVAEAAAEPESYRGVGPGGHRGDVGRLGVPRPRPRQGASRHGARVGPDRRASPPSASGSPPTATGPDPCMPAPASCPVAPRVRSAASCPSSQTRCGSIWVPRRARRTGTCRADLSLPAPPPGLPARASASRRRVARCAASPPRVDPAGVTRRRAASNLQTNARTKLRRVAPAGEPRDAPFSACER